MACYCSLKGIRESQGYKGVAKDVQYYCVEELVGKG
jgi:hypothetical protein